MNDRSMVNCLAELNGCTFDDMRKELVRIGIISEDESIVMFRKSMPWTKGEREEMIRMINKGMSPAEVSAVLGRTVKSVTTKLFECGIRLRNLRKENDA